jgi:hypothetical protein
MNCMLFNSCQTGERNVFEEGQEVWCILASGFSNFYLVLHLIRELSLWLQPLPPRNITTESKI